MAHDSDESTAIDYVVTALSPVMISGLVGSLVFFFAEVLYAGKYEERLLWTLFFFVVGMVLVSRVSIVVDRARATLYGLMLGAVSWMALMAFIDYPRNSPMSAFAPLINLVLILVIWWCSSKLTWDCTFIDEARQSSDRGLLAVLGLEKTAVIHEKKALAAEEEVEIEEEDLSLLERWRKFRADRAKKPHTPGTSIIWFSLAALPIFGLGQSLIPPDDEARRSFTFRLAAVYVGCALGLLVTTSFLGLRRYLRQRRLPMPKSMTALWLGLGGALIFAFLIVGAILPRPYSETPIIKLSRADSTDRKASKNAVGSKDAGKGEGKPGEQTTPGDGKTTAKKGDPGGSGKGDPKNKSGSGKEDGKDSGRDGDRKDGGSGRKSDDKADSSKSEKSAEGREPNRSDSDNRDSLEKFQSGPAGKILETVASILKWIVFLLILLLVLAVLFQGALGYLANFMPWAKRWLDSLRAWWASLFGGTAPVTVQEKPRETQPRRIPFSSFRNPFESGFADGHSLEEVVGYSFAALEAWGAERNLERDPSQTPLEFSGRIITGAPEMEPHAHLLAVLVVRVAYARGALPKNAKKTLEDFWARVG